MNGDLAWAHAAALEMGEQHALRLTPQPSVSGDQAPGAVETEGPPARSAGGGVWPNT